MNCKLDRSSFRSLGSFSHDGHVSNGQYEGVNGHARPALAVDPSEMRRRLVLMKKWMREFDRNQRTTAVNALLVRFLAHFLCIDFFIAIFEWGAVALLGSEIAKSGFAPLLPSKLQRLLPIFASSFDQKGHFSPGSQICDECLK